MRIKLGYIILIVFLFPSCATVSNSGLEQRNEEVTIQIGASKLDVFDATTQVFIQKGFSITASNERIGLVATDYKDVKKSFGGSFVLALFGREDMEVMLTSNIRSAEGGCTLSILPKGRVKKSSKFKEEYEETTLSSDFMKNIDAIGQEIKALAEEASGGAVTAQPPNTNKGETIKRPAIYQVITPENNAVLKVESGSQIIVIKVPVANVRQLPSTQSPIIGTLKQGNQVKLIGVDGDWFEVLIEGNAGLLTGYVNKLLAEIKK